MVENGVAPESVRVPVAALLAIVRVAVPLVGAVKATVVATVTEPESSENVALLYLYPEL